MQVENTTAKKTVNTRKPLTEEQKRAAAEKRAATIKAKAEQEALSTFSLAAYAALMISACLAKGSKYYDSAIKYHAKTVFPRERLKAHHAYIAALPADKAKALVDEVRAQHDNRTLASGNKNGQVFFDYYVLSHKR